MLYKRYIDIWTIGNDMTEKELHKDIMEIIFYQYKSMWEMTYHPVNESKWNRWDNIFMGNSKGVPDIIIDYPKGKYHGMRIEIKTKKGIISEKQKLWVDRLNKYYYYTVIIRSTEEAMYHLNRYYRGINE